VFVANTATATSPCKGNSCTLAQLGGLEALGSGRLSYYYQPFYGTRREFTMNGQNRQDIKPGLRVDIVLKQDQRTGKRTRGIVRDILTNSAHHPHGIKVRLETGEVGRVQEILD
jgi:uncharacterized repeat protein (TIGR03833 family)